jgi:hypothetical protein
MTLAAWWLITPDRTKKSVQSSTQQGIHTCLNPTLAQQFPTNDWMLHYKRLLLNARYVSTYLIRIYISKLTAVFGQSDSAHFGQMFW